MMMASCQLTHTHIHPFSRAEAPESSVGFALLACERGGVKDSPLRHLLTS